MSTTRHLVNRQRRLAASRATRTPHKDALRIPSNPKEARRRPSWALPDGPRPVRRPLPWPLLLALLAVLAGGFALLAHTKAEDLRGAPALRNTAVTDTARTSEVKGVVSKAVGAVFSYDHTAPDRTQRAADDYLTGKAVGQHQDMLARIRRDGGKSKLVLTTTVTRSGVEVIDGSRARVLVFADQSNTSTAKGGSATYAAAMFAVDVTERGGSWRIANIDTFDR
ncbi:Mce-associated membrane protein [Streptomyces sp. SLBN-118]|uniref:hypothetical protein n=1 Tax=Streptomyces sp. SLBN-118 TaxID=2768454 RepID=UPI0011507E35|nr:hypothetical protein [Streptomyces sp. SLBN-118]TQK51710.1 Mce-associated membrane protein [Streptomyces sp. SLBN-118]